MSTTKVAIITGAAQGIGKAISTRLAVIDGYDVSLTDILSQLQRLETVKQEIQTKVKGRSARVHIVTGDISQEEDVKRIVDDTVEVLGGIDAFIANAGICLAKPFLDITAEEWDHVFAVNARGTFLSYKYAAKQMIQQGRGGRIVGACSSTATGGARYMAAYGSTKWAIRGLTATAALEFGPHGITVNAYAPSGIPTDLSNSIASSFGLTPEALFTAEKDGVAVPNMATTDDVAGIVSYFVSPEAHFTTGQTVIIDGGR